MPPWSSTKPACRKLWLEMCTPVAATAVSATAICQPSITGPGAWGLEVVPITMLDLVCYREPRERPVDCSSTI